MCVLNICFWDMLLIFVITAVNYNVEHLNSYILASWIQFALLLDINIDVYQQ